MKRNDSVSSTTVTHQLITIACIHTFLVVESTFILYYYLRPTIQTLILATILIEGGGLWGAFVTWLFFSKTYSPNNWKNLYPHLPFSSLLLILPILGVQLTSSVPPWIKHETILLLGSPFLTYFIFYTVLAYQVRKENTKNSNLAS